MLTIKLVVIGASGVGKTSLRNQYISGRYSTGYRATIGADFIAKALPHPTKPEEKVTLQIWDTAGQERFASLSSALFRGADAVLLMFDVNDQKTLHALERWWLEFRDHVGKDVCAVVVGNKTDMGRGIERDEAEQFVRQLIPIPSTEIRPLQEEDHDEDPHHDDDEPSISPSSSPLGIPITSHPLSTSPSARGRTTSTAAATHNRSRSSSRFYSVGTTTTTLSIYHTPLSSYSHSYLDSAGSSSRFESAQSSPSRRLTHFSNASTTSNSSSGSTVTPSLFNAKRTQSHDSLRADVSTTATTPELPAQQPSPSHTPVFYTSAKTGEGVQDVFYYIASSVIRKWEYDERRMGIEEAGHGSTLALGLGDMRTKGRASCC